MSVSRALHWVVPMQPTPPETVCGVNVADQTGLCASAGAAANSESIPARSARTGRERKRWRARARPAWASGRGEPSRGSGLPLGRWAAGPLGRWAAGPLGRWAAGPLGRWAAGPLGRWAAGPLGRWAAGPLGRWAMIQFGRVRFQRVCQAVSPRVPGGREGSWQGVCLCLHCFLSGVYDRGRPQYAAPAQRPVRRARLFLMIIIFLLNESDCELFGNIVIKTHTTGRYARGGSDY